ncbi:hypothetical protein M427DRAFT_35265 [Gonapodya prolifera JEL478]|uniref:Pescadillo homolog n=1 Tax=Gonapodya prolifera (strain JEL478) TaxID=1344416 RepID=A0A139A681_GONPJ|nr:hypothetical protein M427DRAFT_35265 [Gonapodya prolifera JEL478]|eukprot:KXS11955.1 hypothetical protein M427DRAFT_35265 [Gonapodya prolifera JEL478]
MGKAKKKGDRGAASNFISRTRAVKKLQVSLADFRKLCILKGVYPRAVPTAALKRMGASTAPRTYYYTKDIQYLLHEPLVAQFRRNKVYIRKIRQAANKGESDLVLASLEREWKMQEIGIEHIIKERYPTFSQALHDLPDALTLLHTFLRLPSGKTPSHATIPSSTLQLVRRLCAEWQYVTARRGMLKRSFVSVKGVYYGVELGGGEQEVVWVVPHEFNVGIPATVDIRILLTFLQLYTTLVRFVNHKLFTDANLTYPPRLRLDDADGEGNEAIRWIAAAVEGEEKWEGEEVMKKIGERAAAGNGAGDATGGDAMDVEVDVSDRVKSLPGKIAAISDMAAQSQDTTTTSADAPSDAATPSPVIPGAVSPPGIFTPTHVFLSRETPVAPLLYLLRANGARYVTVDHPTSPYSIQPYSDRGTSAASLPPITHHVTDRPLTHRVFDRAYVQPQWVFDSVNAGKVLDEWAYRTDEGVVLPPHRSPWGRSADDIAKAVEFEGREEYKLDAEDDVSDGEEDEAENAEGVADEEIEGSDLGIEDEEEGGDGADDDTDGEVEQRNGPAVKKDVSNKKASAQKGATPKPVEVKKGGKSGGVSKLPSLNRPTTLSDLSDPTFLHSLELEAESLGLSSSDFSRELEQGRARLSGGKAGKRKREEDERKKKEEEDKDTLEMRKAMMSKRDKRLYERMMFGIEKKKEEERKLETRRAQIQKEAKAKAKAEAKANASTPAKGEQVVFKKHKGPGGKATATGRDV